MAIEFDTFSKSAKGGTEIIKCEMQNRLPKEFLNKFQIITDRFENLDETKIRIYWSHLNPEINEKLLKNLKYKNTKPLSNGGWRNFHKLVFVSHYQMENWIKTYNIPRNYCIVIKNAINPIQFQKKPKDKIILTYNAVPDRGLSLLVNVFEKLCSEHDNIELKIYSSWEIYGMKTLQKKYENSTLYQKLENHPKINNIGYVSNEKVKKSLAYSHICAYPNITPETSCLSLLEAMSAGCLCVHPNYGGLPETASNWTMMYPYHEKIILHEEKFYYVLKKAINIVNDQEIQSHLKKQKEYVDYFFNWEKRIQEWIELLKDLENLSHKKILKSNSFLYQ